MTRTPLSRSYLHAAWPIAAFNVMSKPTGAGCNRNRNPLRRGVVSRYPGGREMISRPGLFASLASIAWFTLCAPVPCVRQGCLRLLFAPLTGCCGPALARPASTTTTWSAC